jgi:hypothetical protein
MIRREVEQGCIKWENDMTRKEWETLLADINGVIERRKHYGQYSVDADDFLTVFYTLYTLVEDRAKHTK